MKGIVYFKNGTQEDIVFYRRHSWGEKVIFYTKDKMYFYNEMTFRAEKFAVKEPRFFEMYITINPFEEIPQVRWIPVDDIEKIELFDEERG